MPFFMHDWLIKDEHIVNLVFLCKIDNIYKYLLSFNEEFGKKNSLKTKDNFIVLM